MGSKVRLILQGFWFVQSKIHPENTAFVGCWMYGIISGKVTPVKTISLPELDGILFDISQLITEDPVFVDHEEIGSIEGVFISHEKVVSPSVFHDAVSTVDHVAMEPVLSWELSLSPLLVSVIGHSISMLFGLVIFSHFIDVT